MLVTNTVLYPTDYHSKITMVVKSDSKCPAFFIFQQNKYYIKYFFLVDGSKNCLSGPEDSKIDEYSLIQQSVLVAKVFEKLCSGLSVEKCVKRSAAPLRTRTTEPVRQNQ